MKFKLNKILGSFVSSGAIESTDDDDDYNIKEIISAIDEKVFAVSKKNVLFAKISELGGYFYVITIIVGRFKIKTNKGATLSLEGSDFDLVLNSDMDEFESDHSNVPNRYITRIDFQIEEEDVPKFDKKSIKILKLLAKKQEILFNTL